jgi:hypothetical protein
VEYNTKKVFEVKLKELRTTLTSQIAENMDVGEVTEMVKQRCREASLPDVDVVRTIWDAIMDAVQWSGKNQQQNSNLALRQVCSSPQRPSWLRVTVVEVRTNVISE